MFSASSAPSSAASALKIKHPLNILFCILFVLLMSAIETDDLDWITPPDADAANAALKAAIQAELTEARGIEMGFLRQLDAKAKTEEGQADLPRLSNAAVKAARALRQIGVLQLEIAGLRDQPGHRAPAAALATAPANQNAPQPKPYKNGPKPRDDAWTNGDYTEYDDYTDRELEACRDAKMGGNVQLIAEAMRADLIAHGRMDAANEAPIDQVELVRAIPHPALDTCINNIEPYYSFLVFGEDKVQVGLRPGAPNVWAEYDAKKGLYARDRQDSS